MFLLALAVLFLAHPDSLPSPADTVRADAPRAERLVVPGSAEEDRLRMRLLPGEVLAGGFVARAPSSSLQVYRDADTRLEPIAPRMRTVWNSGLPFSFNEGALWAGRGMNAQASVGLQARIGPLAVVLAPQVIYQENRDFQTFSRPSETRERHELASPFHHSPESIDMPQRPGFEPVERLDPGQSSVALAAGPLYVGAATENLWWGPGVRNGIVMSSHAPGIPHAFVRTGAPLQTRAGAIEGRWIVGRLEESPYFEGDPENGFRSISALVVALSPRFEPGLTLGFARAVYAPAEGRWPGPGAALDVLRSVGRPAAEPGEGSLEPAPDQLFSVFGRWHFPESGLEAWFEWGRYEQPASLRDLLEMPGHTQGYTVGAQWARPAIAASLFRLQTEVSYLEPSASFRVRPLGDWYTSRTVPQGYTHRGQVIGASIGPGGSSQWLAADLLGERWHGGAFGGRIRWENQAQFTYFSEYRFSDVTLFTGLRGGADLGRLEFDVQLASSLRYNYLFQVRPSGPFHHRGVDVYNHSLSVTLSGW